MPFPANTPQKWRTTTLWFHTYVCLILCLMYLRNTEITNVKLVWYLKIFCETFYHMLKDGNNGCMNAPQSYVTYVASLVC